VKGYGGAVNGKTRIVELTGLAGAGKSTTARMLAQRSPRVVVEQAPYFRRIRDIPFFVSNAIMLLPTLIHLPPVWKRSKRFRAQALWMMVLRGWRRRLERFLSNDGQTIIMDQGPICTLTLLYVFGSETLGSPRLRKWWLETCRQWAGTLDAIAWLDAPSEVLVERIRARAVWHGVKEKTDAEAYSYLGQYREAYRYVLSLLGADGGGPNVIEIDTSREPVDNVVARLCLELGLETDSGE
jgi:thymidylate kinase